MSDAHAIPDLIQIDRALFRHGDEVRRALTGFVSRWPAATDLVALVGTNGDDEPDIEIATRSSVIDVFREDGDEWTREIAEQLAGLAPSPADRAYLVLCTEAVTLLCSVAVPRPTSRGVA